MDALRHQKHMQWMQNRKDIYYFIRKYAKYHKTTPPTKKIYEELDISVSAVQRHLRQFEEDGLIAFNGYGSHRTYELIGVKKHETL